MKNVRNVAYSEPLIWKIEIRSRKFKGMFLVEFIFSYLEIAEIKVARIETAGKICFYEDGL